MRKVFGFVCAMLGESLLVVIVLAGPLMAEGPRTVKPGPPALPLAGGPFGDVIPDQPGTKGTAPPARSKVDVEPGAVEVRFADGSVLKMILRDEKFTIVTEYGKLAVPVADVQRIEFATRIPDELQRKIEAAVAKLGSSVLSERELASKELLKIGAPAYPFLKAALKDKDTEVKRRAEELVDKIKASAPAQALEVRKDDVLHTKDMKIKGQIENAVFKVDTFPLGAVQVKLTDMRVLRSQAIAEPEAETLVAVPDPGRMHQFANQFGTKHAFTVTGHFNGTLWGTQTYTLDSTLACAAVHCGVLKPGQTGVVKVEIVPSPPVFVGTAQNGMASNNYGPYNGGAYKIIIPDPEEK